VAVQAPAAQGNGTPAPADATQQTQADEPTKTYPTKDECEKNPPAKVGKKEVYGVTKDGVTRYLWAAGYVNAMDRIARIDGYTVSKGGKTKEVTKDQVAARLAQFTDAELAAMGLSRTPTTPAPAVPPPTPAAPAPTAPTTKGRGRK
jgi:hypothetical protein